MAHAAVAAAFAAPNLELADAEGEKLAESVKKVLRHYDIPDVASETKDWIGLIIVCGTIYGPRFIASRAEKKMNQPAQRAEGNNVVELTVGGSPA